MSIVHSLSSTSSSLSQSATPTYLSSLSASACLSSLLSITHLPLALLVSITHCSSPIQNRMLILRALHITSSLDKHHPFSPPNSFSIATSLVHHRPLPPSLSSASPLAPPHSSASPTSPFVVFLLESRPKHSSFCRIGVALQILLNGEKSLSYVKSSQVLVGNG